MKRMIVLMAAAVLLTGCGATVTAPGASAAGPPAVGSCPPSSGPIAIVASGRANSPRPRLTGLARTVVESAVVPVQGPPVTLISLDGAPVVRVPATPFQSDAGNGPALDEDRRAFLTSIDTALDDLRATTPEADVLGALALGARAARGRDGRGTVLLSDSGLQTVAPLDLREPDLLDADPADIVSHLATQHAIPDLTGLTVVLTGIGDVVAPQPSLDTRRHAQLLALWTHIAQAGHAACVAVDAEPRVADPVAGDLPPVGLVPVPPVPTIDAAALTPIVLPDDATVGFVPGRAEFRDPAAAAALLRPLAAWQAAAPTRTLRLTGTTARWGPAEGQRGLALARAEAVKTAIVTAGGDSTRIETIGAGSWFPAYVDDTGPDGTLLPGPASRNRTVIIERAE